MSSHKRFNRKGMGHVSSRSSTKARVRAFESLEARLCLSGAEIHGMAYFGDILDPQPLAGIKVFLDEDADSSWDEGELWAVTNSAGEYTFADLDAGTYRVAEVVSTGYMLANPASGFRSMTLLAEEIEEGVDFRHANQPAMVDVFFLVDDTGSFDSPQYTAEFLGVANLLIEDLAGSAGAYPEISWGFGVGRYEEYANWGSPFSYPSDRPFILSQPIIEYDSVWTNGQTTVTFAEAIEAAILRRTPGYGGDGPESMVEALYQVATGEGFDGNDDEDTIDSGAAGLYATQVTPGDSGDVPAFDTFEPDPEHDIIPPAVDVEDGLGGVGFREGAMRVVLVATDMGIRYQVESPPLGPEDLIYGLDGVPVEYSRFTTDGIAGTPRGEGAQIQETVTALNELEILVIGIGKSTYPINHDPTRKPRTALEAFAECTGAIYRGTGTLQNGTNDLIEPGDPLYFNLDTVGGYTLRQGLLAGLSSQVTSVPGTIEGAVWYDLNGNGIEDETNARMAGVTVYFDWNENGVPDAGDLTTVTNASGEYSFENLVPGEYPLKIEAPADYKPTTYYDAVTIRRASQIVADFGIQEAAATNDACDTNEDTPLEITLASLLANDTNPSPVTNTVVSFAFEMVTQPGNGTLTRIEPDPPTGPAFRYEPDPDFHGTDTFRYALTGDGDFYDWATVTINVSPVNDAPRFYERLRTVTDEPISGVLGYDVEGEAIQMTLWRGAEHARALEIHADGTFSYTPAEGWTGIDHFYVRATDGTAYSPITEIAGRGRLASPPPPALTQGRRRNTMLVIFGPSGGVGPRACAAQVVLAA
ncbi:MAG: carboxypeptidase regulatory-like domain-containing protein [Pirellulales bacterium]|nr:carboxypeptidase regulatory-like domain-containing protein [Pirellulales bacterium]